MEVIWVCWCKEQATFLLEVEIEEGTVSSRRAKLLCVHTDVNVYSSLELDVHCKPASVSERIEDEAADEYQEQQSSPSVTGTLTNRFNQSYLELFD